MTDFRRRDLARLLAANDDAETRRAYVRQLEREGKKTLAVATLAAGRNDSVIQQDLARLPACQGPWVGPLTKLRTSAFASITPISKVPSQRWRFPFESGLRDPWERETSHLVASALIVVVVLGEQVAVGLDPYSGELKFELGFGHVRDILLDELTILFCGQREPGSRTTIWACAQTDGRLLWELERTRDTCLLGRRGGFLFVWNEQQRRVSAFSARLSGARPRGAPSWSFELEHSDDPSFVCLTDLRVFVSAGHVTSAHRLNGEWLYRVEGGACLAASDVLLTRTGAGSPRNLRRGVLVGRDPETGDEIFRVDNRRGTGRTKPAHRRGSRHWSVASGVVNRDVVLVSTWLGYSVRLGLLLRGNQVERLPGRNTTALALVGEPLKDLVVYQARGAHEGGPDNGYARLCAYRIDLDRGLTRLWSRWDDYDDPIVERLCPLEGAVVVATADALLCLEAPGWGEDS